MGVERVLITGANGFVGRHLILQLIASSDNVDITACALPDEVNAANAWMSSLKDERVSRQVHWLPVNITHADSARNLVDTAGPNSIYHLAARASGADTDREAVFATNVEGTRYLLQAAAKLNALMLIISTGYAYGDTTPDRPARETDQLASTGRYGAYTDSKIAMERIAAEFAGIALIARSFSHTGPGQTTAFAIPSFARQLARIERGIDEPTIKVGNLEAFRDILDVRDVVRAYRLVVSYSLPGEVYNVASGSPHRMRDVLDMLRGMISVPVEIQLDSARLRAADIACSTGDSSRLHQLTGWQPDYKIERTLRDTLDWWRANDS